MRTRIELGTSGSIDLSDDVPYSLNFAIADIRTPDKRDASYSKTIKIPGSKQNDRLFAHIFEIDIDCNFNPNIKTPCILYIDEIQQLKGYLQLLKIYTTDELKVEYEVTIKGAIGNIFTAIGDNELTDLDLSEYNHNYNKTVQKASWTATVGQGYVYPMIDYGQTNGVVYDVTNFYPAIYVKQYVDKIFASVGYTYSSNFFNSEFFKRLIIPYNGVGIGLYEDDLTDRLVALDTKLPTPTYSIPASGAFTDPNTDIVQFSLGSIPDVLGQFNSTTNKITIAETGVYNYAIEWGFETVDTGTAIGGISILMERAGVVSHIGSTTFRTITTSAPASATYYTTNNFIGQAGDKIWAGYYVKKNTGSPTTLTSNAQQAALNPVNSGLSEGADLLMNTAIPLKVKQKDLLTSLIQMFNLYIETDKNDETKLSIEPRNDFYSSGTTIDWTDKWDVSQPLQQEPMGALDAKKYIYSYKDDKDYYNTLYKNSYLEAYGTYTHDVGNDFLTQTKDNKLIFSPTPLWDGSGFDRIISVMIPTDLSSTELKGTNIRILYYGGVKTTLAQWVYTGLVSGTSLETTYSYAGHLDSPQYPDVDLNFGVPKEVYYTTTLYTNNHLFNKYHKQFIEEITDKDSKIITGWFYLTPKDILTLDFRNQFLVDGHLLRLNKIYDYNPVNSELTKCEFIKIKQAQQFVRITKTSYGGVDTKFP